MLFAAGHLYVRGCYRVAEIGVGLLGGVLGGIAGLSGPPPIVWGALRAWPKAQRRQTLQVFNTVVLTAMLLASLVSGLVDVRLLVASAIALPATFLGHWLGDRLYRSAPDRHFDRLSGRLVARGSDRIVRALVVLAGCVLVWTNRGGLVIFPGPGSATTEPPCHGRDHASQSKGQRPGVCHSRRCPDAGSASQCPG